MYFWHTLLSRISRRMWFSIFFCFWTSQSEILLDILEYRCQIDIKMDFTLDLGVCLTWSLIGTWKVWNLSLFIQLLVAPQEAHITSTISWKRTGMLMALVLMKVRFAIDVSESLFSAFKFILEQ
jgi:hypothetical protein